MIWEQISPRFKKYLTLSESGFRRFSEFETLTTLKRVFCLLKLKIIIFCFYVYIWVRFHSPLIFLFLDTFLFHTKKYGCLGFLFRFIQNKMQSNISHKNRKENLFVFGSLKKSYVESFS